MTSALTLTPEPLDGDLARTLIGELQAEYVTRYGGQDATPVAAEQFAPPSGGFWVLRHAGRAIGCAGLRRHDAVTAELKRMYVRAAHRGQGRSRWLLARMEQRARDLGYRRIVLETGNRQPEALALYTSSGYAPTAAFGRYACSPDSTHLARDL